jgi:intein/homing endonuclease
MSDKIPKDMISHFLRGYFDGDGSVVKIGNYLRANFTSGSTVLLNQIVDYMYNSGIRVRNEDGKAKIFQSSHSISYSCKNALQVLDLMYAYSTELTRLDRKYQLYLQYKSKFDKEIPIFTQDREYIEKTFRCTEEK